MCEHQRALYNMGALLTQHIYKLDLISTTNFNLQHIFNKKIGAVQKNYTIKYTTVLTV